MGGFQLLHSCFFMSRIYGSLSRRKTIEGASGSTQLSACFGNLSVVCLGESLVWGASGWYSVIRIHGCTVCFANILLPISMKAQWGGQWAVFNYLSVSQINGSLSRWKSSEVGKWVVFSYLHLWLYICSANILFSSAWLVESLVRWASRWYSVIFINGCTYVPRIYCFRQPDSLKA
jgi:hypothetical protein